MRCAAAVLALTLLGACACQGPEPEARPTVRKASREIMSTQFEVSVSTTRGAEVQEVMGAALDEVERVERVMSSWRQDSELARVNAAAGGAPVPVSAELLGLVRRAQQICELSEGRMDISFKPLGRIWNFRAQPFVPPTEEAVAAARALVDCSAVEIDDQASTLRLPRSGMAMGLGAIAKGYAVDRASQVLLEAGLVNHLVNGGGDLVARGSKAEGPWTVGVQHPRERGGLIGKLPLRDRALVTSGDYERYAVHEGKRYHHIIDPRTGWPAQGLISVTVLADSAERADALATALLVAGPEEAQDLLRRLPGLDAFLVAEDGQYWMSESLAEQLSLVGVLGEEGAAAPIPPGSR